MLALTLQLTKIYKLFFNFRQIKYKYVKHHQGLSRKKRNKYGDRSLVYALRAVFMSFCLLICRLLCCVLLTN